MTIFNIVGQDFFKPLTSYLKNLYFDCLEIIYNSYSSELSYGIDREILVSTLPYCMDIKTLKENLQYTKN
jgi:hypothetical protein